MTQNASKQPGKGNKIAQKPGNPRATHSIRFTDSEWKLIQRAAELHGIPAGQLVRNGAMAAAEELLDEPPAVTFSSGHAALIESIYRMVYMMATLDRGRLLDAGRGKELENLIAAARRTMAETMEEGPA
ncbi:MAG: hypothetical protein F4X91_05880 [Nitrospinae bacterium]|nr:hypothetical protein [Nitrospinota bacterium]